MVEHPFDAVVLMQMLTSFVLAESSHFDSGRDKIVGGELHCKAIDTWYVLKWALFEFSAILNGPYVALSGRLGHEVADLVARSWPQRLLGCDFVEEVKECNMIFVCIWHD